MKKIILVLVTVLILSQLSCLPIHADEYNGIKIETKSQERLATQQEIQHIKEYELQVDTDTDYVSFIIDRSHIIGTINTAKRQVVIYESNELQNHLPKCNTINEIMYRDSIICIDYISVDGLLVNLVYNSAGLVNKTVYDENTDTIIIDDARCPIVIDFFREGIYYSMSDDLSNRIFEYAEKGEIDKIRQIEGLSVIVDEYGQISVEPIIMRSQPISNPQLLNSLKADWPMYTNSVRSVQNKYCSALQQNVTVKVTETRNTYVRNSANWMDFIIGTLVSSISMFLGISSSGTISILDALGIGIDIYNQIEDAVSLCNSAEYNYHGTRRGCVYDTTVYNQYVLILRYAGEGKFSGGYSNTGDFVWTHSIVSTAYSYPYPTISNNSLTNYNNDLLANNNLCTYYPEYYLWSD